MAQTDARAGFRLPWNSERSGIDQTDTDVAEAEAHPAEPAEADTAAPDAQWGSDVVTDSGTPGPDGPSGQDDRDSTSAADAGPAAPAAKKQSKFMADLTKAMQAAAEDARNQTLSQFQADAKNYVEQIHARSATEAADLRRKADDDVAAIREWSKTEIARIREETESKITARKARLEGEVDGHAATIEREIELIQSRVTGFEEEMAAFFERLLAEGDPTHFATMAENLPEPTPFESMVSAGELLAPREAAAAETEAETTEDEPTAEAHVAETADAEADAVESGEAEATAEAESTDETTGEAETGDDAESNASSDATLGDIEVPADFEIDRESAFAAIQAAAEAAASAEVATDAASRAEAVADIAIEIVGHRDDETEEASDPRVAALGLSADFDAAEAEAAQAADAGGDTEEIPEINDDALAARLAGLVPGKGGDKAASTDAKATQVVVVGLVSVASIASFKRHLGRLPGVQSVGVSSGPDGEFLFAVNHGADVVLRDAIPSMPSFQARVTGSGDGVLNVTAHDPESDN